ncbi:hypothetical protein F4801DRAFT_548910 [Xylaria longipes]|nr:hypothetical protein F4801DRAFT_548910 [Xylaria longipes]
MDPDIPAVRSAQLPVMEPDVVDLIRMIDNGRSCNAIFRQLCNSSLVANAASANDLDTDDNRLLFHSLPLPLLRSLLMGTLGPHFYSRDARRDNWNDYVYDDNYSGAYAAFLHINHRRGAFLSQRETRQLIVALEKYSAGVRLYDHDYRQGYRVFGTAEREALEFTQVIDDELRQVTHWDPRAPNRFNCMERPRFAKSETRRIGTAGAADSSINALVDMFDSRCTIDESDSANPDLDVFQLQSPIMVGNAGYIRARIINHLTDDHGSGAGTSKVYALTMSCLMHLNFDVKSAALPIFLTWEEDQIDPAEVLGTVLANSRLPGHGYNVKMPGTRGGRTPNPRLEQAKEHVFYWKPFLEKNLEQSLDELRDEAVADVKADVVKGLANARREIDEFKRSLDEARKAETDLETADMEWQEVIEAAKTETEAARKAYSEFAELLKEHEDFMQLLEVDEASPPADQG